MTERAPDGYSIFISYAHQDEAFKDQLTQQLKGLQRQGLIAPWHDRCIGAFFDGVVRPAGSADQSAASTMAPRSLSTITGDSK